MSNSSLHRVVIYTPYKWEHALVSLRLTRPLQQAGIELIRGNDGMDIHPERVSQAEAVVLQREFPENLEVYEQILTLARAEQKPVIYEIDDQLFELPENHIDYPTHYYSPALFAMLRAVIEADLVTTTTFHLQKYLRRFNPQTILLPNYLDDSLWTLAQPAPDTLAAPSTGDQVVIGYMGSDTHQPDLETVTPLLAQLLERYPDRLRLRFWCAQPPESLRSHPLVEWIPVSIPNYAEFAAYFSTQTCDFFIAPLIDSEFNRCKSSIKFLEYSALGIPGVYSRTAPYQAMVQEGRNGFLATSDTEWEAHLTALIESAELRSHMGQQALHTVQQDWLLSQHADEWLQAYQQAWHTAHDQQAQQSRQVYLDVFIAIANQVRHWQNKIYNQVIERDVKIQSLQNQIAEQVRLNTTLQAQAAESEGLVVKLLKRLDRKLLAAARRLRKQ